MITLNINGRSHDVDVPPDMPVLWVLRDVVGLTGTKFGCGVAACGACTVHLEGRAIRSCVTPASAVAGKAIVTIEAIGDTPPARRCRRRGSRWTFHNAATVNRARSCQPAGC
jgi:isoquinoline 1-oxidoreductase subunit alpha